MVYGYIRDRYQGFCLLSEDNKLKTFRRWYLAPFSWEKLVICKVSFEDSKSGQSDVGQASRRGRLWDETNSKRRTIWQSPFDVTQRLTVWYCTNSDSLSPKRWYWPTRLHGAITQNTQLLYWKSQTKQHTQDGMGRVFSMFGREEKWTVACMEESVGDL